MNFRRILTLVLVFVFTSTLQVPGAVKLWGDPTDYGTISNAVKAAINGDTVVITTGDYNEVVSIIGKSIDLDGGYNIDCTAKIPGGTSTMDPSETGKPVLYITNANVNVTDMVLTGGRPFGGSAMYGGGLYVDDNSHVSAIDCLIEDNEANGHGGGIYLHDSYLSLTGTVVQNNRAYDASVGITLPEGRGGGIYCSGGDLYLEGSSHILNNYAEDSGGGIYAVKGALCHASDFNCYVGGNRAIRGGGIAAANGAKIYIEDGTVVYSNVASEAGGGMLLYNGATGIVRDANTVIGYRTGVFGPNHATNGNGGGVAVHDSYLGVSLSARIYHNTASSSGGGIYLSNAICVIDDGRIGFEDFAASNSAQYGGGIFSDYGSRLTVQNGSDIQWGFASLLGGGICARSQSIITLRDSTIRRCSAGTYGGGAYFNGSVVTGVNMTIASNVCVLGHGGGFYGNNTDADFSSMEFTNNAAAANGGGLAWVNADLYAFYTLFSRNSAGRDGGAMNIQDCNASFNDLRAISNVATNDGGGVYLSNTVFAVTNATFTKNIADRDQDNNGNGGGIYVDHNCDLLLGHDLSQAFDFTGNGALYGGGIFAVGSTLRMRSSLSIASSVYSNKAFVHGGGIYVSDCDLTITGTVLVTENTAWLDGGGIYADGSAVTLSERTNWFAGTWLDNNNAWRNGGALCSQYSTVSLQNVVFSDNTASNFSGACDLVDSVIQGDTLSFRGNRSLSSDAGAMYGFNTAGDLGHVTVSNNTAAVDGGGLVWENESLYLYDAVVANNMASNDGGGLHLTTGSAALKTVLFKNNRARENGGGVSVWRSSTLSATNSSFVGNQADSDLNFSGIGGAIYVASDSSVEFRDPLVTQMIRSNRAYRGGAVAVSNSYFYSFGNVRIKENDSTDRGGAFYVQGATVDVWSAYIERNTATNYGGGIYSYAGAQVNLRDTLLAENRAENTGGGLRVLTANAYNHECTIISNYPSGVEIGSGSSFTGQSLIVYGNDTLGISAGYDVSYSCVQGGYAGTSNFDVNPLLYNENYHLTYLSPCRSKGPFSIGGYDVDDEARHAGKRDIGFDEFWDDDQDLIPNTAETDTGIWTSETDTGTDPSVADSDSDGVIDGEEWIANTDPNDISAYLHLLGVTLSGGTPYVSWIGGTSSVQILEYCPDTSLTNWIVDKYFVPPTPVTNGIAPIYATNAMLFRVTARRP